MNMYSMPNNYQEGTEKYYTHDAPNIPLASTEVEVKGYGSLSVLKAADDNLIKLQLLRPEVGQVVEVQQETQESTTKVRVKRLNK